MLESSGLDICRRLEERRKKRKKIREGENVGIHARDEVKFGEVVDAPPKLVAVPKVLQAVDAFHSDNIRYLIAVQVRS